MDTTDTVLYRDVFGKLAAADGRLIWQGSDLWWDEGDEPRWRKLGDLNHPAIARVQATRRESGQLTLEFASPPGQPLSTLLDSSTEHPSLDALNGLALLVQLAGALETMHSQDLFGLSLTPATVFARLDGGELAFTLVPVLAPISMGKLSPEVFLAAEEPIGALPYVSQERLRSRQVAPAADVYALGMLGYQVLWPKQMPVYTDKADLIHASVAGRFPIQDRPTEEGGAYEVVRQCLARRPGRRPTASEARIGLSAALRETLCQPCEQARQQREAGDLQAALETLSEAKKDAIKDCNPRLHLMRAELLAQMNPADPLPVIEAGRAAAERVERLLDEGQMTAPVDRYFAAHLFASPADVQLAAREIYTLLATVYRQEGLLQKAIEQYDRALKVAGDDGQLLLAYAKMLRQAGRPGEALRALERAEKVGVTDLHLLLLEKARAMERQGMLDQAIEAYESALRITEDGDTWTQLGRLYRATDSTDHSKAMRAFKQAIKCNQYQIEAATYLAESALEQKDEDSALAALDSVRLPDDVRQVSPSVLDNYLEMTNTLMHLVSDRLNKNPTDPAVHHRLGDLYLLHAHLMDNPIDLVRYDLATGDYVRAVLSYEVSLKIDFGQPDLETKVREIYAPLDEERRELERRLSQGETGADVYNRLAMVSWRLARLYGSHETSETRRQAVVLFRRAVEVLDLSIQADLSQREMRRLFAMLAEQLRHMESGG